MSVTPATASHADLAHRLLAQETDLGVEPYLLGLAAAAERVCQKLFQRLSRLVSPAGSQAILSRALHISRAEFPFLAGVRAGRTPQACLEGLNEQVRNVDTLEATRGLLAVLTVIFDLLAGFVGDDLTSSLVVEVWPDLPERAPVRASNAAGQEALP